MLLNDKQITLLAMKGMIEPFTAGQVRTVTKNGQEERVISYGLSSAGYDIRLGRSFKVFKPVWEGLTVVDPKMPQGHTFNEFENVDYCIIPPNSYVLGHSIERFKVPRNVQVLVVGKSTYARCGLIVNVTPGEPGWEGHWTIEISNASPLPAIVYADEGIAQCLFFRIDEPEVSYADRSGKYQGQGAEVVTARV